MDLDNQEKQYQRMASTAEANLALTHENAVIEETPYVVFKDAETTRKLSNPAISRGDYNVTTISFVNAGRTPAFHIHYVYRAWMTDPNDQHRNIPEVKPTAQGSSALVEGEVESLKFINYPLIYVPQPQVYFLQVTAFYDDVFRKNTHTTICLANNNADRAALDPEDRSKVVWTQRDALTCDELKVEKPTVKIFPEEK